MAKKSPICLFIFIVLLFMASPILAEEKPLPSVRIGLFNLLKPRRMELSSTTNINLTLRAHNGNSSREITLIAGDTLLLTQTLTRLNCHLIQQGEKKEEWSTDWLELTGDSGDRVSVTIPGKLTRTIPALAQFQPHSDGIQTVIVLKEDVAVATITASELGESNNLEALKAQAVAVRSYLRAMRNRHNGYDICDNTHCLLYYGEDIFSHTTQAELVHQAVRETSDIFLTFKGKAVPAYFTASCGGLTALPTQVWGGNEISSNHYHSVRCIYCVKDRFYRWQRAIAIDKLWKALRSTLNFTPSEDALIYVAQRSTNGFVTKLVIEDHTRRVEITCARFRHLIGLSLGWNLVLSNSYHILRRGRQILFTGRGFGHNLGLCVAGAVEQARRGYDFRHILNYYFPRLSLSSAVLANPN